MFVLGLATLLPLCAQVRRVNLVGEKRDIERNALYREKLPELVEVFGKIDKIRNSEWGYIIFISAVGVPDNILPEVSAICIAHVPQSEKSLVLNLHIGDSVMVDGVITDASKRDRFTFLMLAPATLETTAVDLQQEKFQVLGHFNEDGKKIIRARGRVVQISEADEYFEVFIADLEHRSTSMIVVARFRRSGVKPSVQIGDTVDVIGSRIGTAKTADPPGIVIYPATIERVGGERVDRAIQTVQ